MALATYIDLKAAIADWLARDDLTSRIPDFITLAEARLQRKFDSLDTERSTTLTGVADTEGYDLPADYKSTRNLYRDSTSKYPLEYMPPANFRAYSPTGAGISAYYTIQNNQIILGPAPSETSNYRLDYVARFVALSDTNDTNWLLDIFPDVYLYGSLIEAARYNKDIESQSWRAEYNLILDEIQEYFDDQKYPTPLRIQSA